MALHVIVGAGPVGTAAATMLADRGERVRVVTRSGGGLAHPAVERVAADATNADRLAALADGAAALYNCANPRYHRWLTDWPPLAGALLTAAERSGAVLATTSTLYGYGEVDGPITTETPLAATHPKLRIRADMWRAALAAHESGRIRATEVRASDYIEANSIFTIALGKPLRAGRRTFAPAPLDVPHSWTSITDVARTLVTAATTERAWGEAWLVPTSPPLTVRELAARFTEVNGLPRARLSELPYAVLWTAGLFSPMIRELRTTRYQFTRPFVLDSSHTEQTFDLPPTDIDTALKNVA
ncbi:NAD-dependent epimerase/dehydratase family protein [Actinophytocola sp.]|uniref:NAD-dependent epimerase/dehydratase family protein n=1 Tax=Actinophytocola sp. TaxID=1872138 RepID=UPI003D6A8FD6